MKKSGTKASVEEDRPVITRAGFVAFMTALLGGAGYNILRWFKHKTHDLQIDTIGPDFTRGHQIRTNRAGSYRSPGAGLKTEEADVLIMGGGIAGLSAAWRLKKAGINKILIIELEDEPGGNSMSGRASLNYPTGAHYLPFPGPEARSCRMVLEDLGIIDNAASERPRVAARHLLGGNEVRMFQAGRWFAGDYPRFVAPADLEERRRFEELVEGLKYKQGSDGRYAFVIPIEKSSHDPAFTRYDQINMGEFLQQQGFESPALYWYVNYACLDDFGAPLEEVSAWAGLHYFCSRRGRHADADEDGQYLVWPGGNGFLADGLLEKTGRDVLRCGRLIRSVDLQPDRVEVTAAARGADSDTVFRAPWAIWSMPLFLMPWLVRQTEQVSHITPPRMSSWMIANLFLERPPRSLVNSMAWDNLLLGADSLGYIVANHSALQDRFDEYILTWYLPLYPETKGREHLLERSDSQWADYIFNELEGAHPQIRQLVKRIELCRRAHAMAIPEPGSLFSGRRQANAALKDYDRLVPAHSDLAGYSLFEEANYFGVRAAEIIAGRMGLGNTSLL